MTDPLTQAISDETRKLEVIAYLARNLMDRLYQGIGDYDVDRRLGHDASWLGPFCERLNDELEYHRKLDSAQ